MTKNLLIIILISTCTSVQQDFTSVPQYSDEEVQHVFSSWDGKWKGVFYIYSDPEGQKREHPLPRNIHMEIIEENKMIKVDSVIVFQEYQSLSPTLQSVQITDLVNNQKVVSTGENKVVNGKLQCMVKKPDELVIHDGEITADGYLIWKRHQINPTKIEYFKEKVNGNQYTIIGWGYYGDDNPKLNPRTWFRAIYNRQ